MLEKLKSLMHFLSVASLSILVGLLSTRVVYAAGTDPTPIPWTSPQNAWWWGWQIQYSYLGWQNDSYIWDTPNLDPQWTVDQITDDADSWNNQNSIFFLNPSTYWDDISIFETGPTNAIGGGNKGWTDVWRHNTNGACQYNDVIFGPRPAQYGLMNSNLTTAVQVMLDWSLIVDEATDPMNPAFANGATNAERVEQLTKMVVAHEIGHALLLDHNTNSFMACGSYSPSEVSVMDPGNVSAISCNFTGPQPADLNGLDGYYGVVVNMPTVWWNLPGGTSC